ncbi:MAG TPA: hypothetical protein VJA47_06260 [archaeon]|nr:hypothetical protein [archaeon]
MESADIRRLREYRGKLENILERCRSFQPYLYTAGMEHGDISKGDIQGRVKAYSDCIGILDSDFPELNPKSH